MGDRPGTPPHPEGQVGAPGGQQLGQHGAGGCWDPQAGRAHLTSIKRLESGCGQWGAIDGIF